MALASLRFPLSASRGRRYPELAHPYRNEFQRDRDRVVHAKAFRRLENKTQVFTPSLSDHFRNRLTHTIEVAQIARTVAGALGLDEGLTEALALVHDIGHPPFAHSGEDELDRLMRQFGDRFDHNLHSLRIVEQFEHRYARFPGLNLTFEVREGMVKHSHDFEAGESPQLDEYLPGLRPPLEAQIIDLADEVAYNTADLDDGLSAGMFAAADVRVTVGEFDAIYDSVENQFPGAEPHQLFLETLRGVIDRLVTGLVEGTLAAVSQAGVETVDEVRRHPQRLVQFTGAAGTTNAELKRFMHAHVYHAADLIAERQRSTAMIGELFERFLREPELMPPGYTVQAESEPLHRVVCDYIAGMTDGFCERTWRELFG
jgi:dGTPase